MPSRGVWRPPAAFDGSDPYWSTERLRALVYVVGVLLKGDGTVYVTRQKVIRKEKRTVIPVPRVELKNKSIEFLDAFNRSLSEVLQRRQAKVSPPNGDGYFMARYRAKDFVAWWCGQKMIELSRIIEAFPVEYLRGRFDSDGSVGKYKIHLVGIDAHRPLMEFEQSLCRKLEVRVGRIRTYGRVGDTTFVNSKRIVSKQQKIRFSVNTRDFATKVGWLNVKWKNKMLAQAFVRRRWTRWDGDARRRALGLRSLGWSCKRIVEELGVELRVDVPYDTVYTWLRRSTLSWDEYSKLAFGD